MLKFKKRRIIPEKFLQAIGIGRKRAQRAPKIDFADVLNASDGDWHATLKDDPERAAQWVESAAVYGDIDAQLTYAQILRDGRGTRCDVDAAFRWFSVAANSGRGDALNMLGRCYETGLGTPVDVPRAAELYAQAAAAGDAWGQFNLANLLLDGTAIARDHDRAFALLQSAAATGHVKSYNMLGLCFEHGWGCVRDPQTAIEWYRRAAVAGDFRGHFSLGCMLATAGDPEGAYEAFAATVEATPPHLCAELADGLAAHPDTRVSQLAEQARLRASPG